MNGHLTSLAGQKLDMRLKDSCLIMNDHEYWEKVEKLVPIYEALYTMLRIVDSEVVPTMPFVYELIQLMKAKLDRLKAKEWVKLIIIDRCDRTLKHPLHAIGY